MSSQNLKSTPSPTDSTLLQNPNAIKARDLAQQAEKTLGKWIYLKGNKWEDALELFTQAANKYKMAKCYHEAGDIFTRIVQCHFKLDSRYEAASAYVDAANCYRKTSVPEAVKCMQQAVHIYTEMGKFTGAAKLEKELGELLEDEMELEQAINHLQTAYDYYEGEGQKSSANTCLIKIAHMMATLERYQEAEEKFELAGSNSLDDRMLKWGAKDHLFKALMCCMAKAGEDLQSQIGEVQEMLERFNDMDVHFPDSYESKLIAKLAKAVEETDLPGFTTALRDYDNISKLDNWKTTIFLRIKSQLEKAVTQPDLT